MRRVEFPGKRRLRYHMVLPRIDERVVVRFPEGMTLKLDLREWLQVDYWAGLHDRHELRLVRRLLRDGGDFVDVGAHVGLYAVCAAVTLGRRGRVLAFEPNPQARSQLEENLALNRCDNAIVLDAAASDRTGSARLMLPRTFDHAFSALEDDTFAGDERYTGGGEVEVATTTVDAEVERHGLEPVLLKVDAQNHELEVLAGARRTLEQGSALLVEVGPESVAEIEQRLTALGHHGYRLDPRRLHAGPLAEHHGSFNALFVPPGTQV